MGDKLRDRVAIVTGAGTGIGKAIAVAFAREGAHVVGAARRLEKLAETAREVRQTERQFLAIRCDVSQKEDCRNVAQTTLKTLGKIDILVNNASIYPVTPFLEITPEEWDEVLAINLKGSMLMCQAVLPHMVERKQGKIIMINSSLSRRSPAIYSQNHYVAAKAGLIGLTRCLAAEFGPMGIQVNGIAPGFTPGTEQADKFWGPVMTPEYMQKSLSLTPLRRYARPEDFQGIAVLLASDESNYITGQTIAVDGGTTMVG
ncbi:MAG: SDR family oxidoreductase [Chloroflexi bacterium]|nr:SDR family oxidoreductase [Chloroflexota bacterium]